METLDPTLYSQAKHHSNTWHENIALAEFVTISFPTQKIHIITEVSAGNPPNRGIECNRDEVLLSSLQTVSWDQLSLLHLVILELHQFYFPL